MGDTISYEGKDPHKFLWKGIFRLDSKKYEVTEFNYTFLMWLASIGGIAKSIHFSLATFVAIVKEPMFVRAVLGNLFMLKRRGEKDEEDIKPQSCPKKNSNPFVIPEPMGFVTKQERMDYNDLKSTLQNEKTISKMQINRIIKHAFTNRMSFNDRFTRINMFLHYILSFCRICKCKRKDRK